MPAATGWAPTLLPSSGGVIACSRFNPELRLPAAIWRARKSWLPEVASLPFVPSQTVRQVCDAYELQVLPAVPFF